MPNYKKLQRKKLTLEDAGRKYLDEIFSGIWLINNPTPLDISGLGKIVATSMVLQRFYDEKIESYFSYQQDKLKGEIIKRDRIYYIE